MNNIVRKGVTSTVSGLSGAVAGYGAYWAFHWFLLWQSPASPASNVAIISLVMGILVGSLAALWVSEIPAKVARAAEQAKPLEGYMYPKSQPHIRIVQ